MDRPTSRRAAIGRALNAREPVATDTLQSLTEEERSQGIALFSDEPTTPGGRHDTFEEGPAPVAPMVATARMFRHVRPADPPDGAMTTVWQAPVLAAMLTAAVVVFAVASVRMMQTPPASHVAVSVTAPSKPVAVAAVRPTAVAPNEVTPAVVPDEEPAPPAPARLALLPAPEPEPPPPPVRAEPPIRTAVVSSAIVAEPVPAVDAPIAPTPVAAVPAAPPPRVEASASVAPARVAAPEAAIQTVLSRYRAAYQELDAAAARAVWPSADTKALRKAFDRLEAQELIFDSCAVSVSEAHAVAVCSGTASYVPRVGKKVRRGDQRQWEFELRKADDGWLIDTVSAR
jgi:hypothetical protein